MSVEQYDIAVIGAGPGGYVAAIRAAQLGLKTLVVERERPGGVCLNWGCIPSKAILKSAALYRALKHEGGLHGIKAEGISIDYAQVIKRSRRVADRLVRGVESLFRKHGITLLKGSARLAGPGRLEISPAEGVAGRGIVEAVRIVIATGSRDKMLPGLERDGKQIINSRDALALSDLPESIAIVGGGAVGLEFAYLYNAFGVAATVIEMERQLLPGADRDVAAELMRCFKKQGISVMTETRVEKVARDNSGVKITARCAEQTVELEAQRLLVAVGREPLTGELGLEDAEIECEGGFIKVDKQLRTNRQAVFAIGDVIGPPLLAHAASEEGIAAVEMMLGRRDRPVDYRRMPTCTYCHPEVASVGLTEEAAAGMGLETVIGQFPFRALGRAVAAGETDGFVKIVAEQETHEVLGCHIIGEGATEMIAEAGLLCTLEGTAAEVIHTTHAHPTLSEALMEAALTVEGRSINF